MALLAAKSLAPGTLGVGGLPSVLEEALGSGVGKVLLADVAFAIFICCLAIQAASIRLTFSMARDHALPFGDHLSHVSEQRKSPALPAIVVGVIAIAILVVNLGNAQIFLVVTSVSIVIVYIAYLLVTVPACCSGAATAGQRTRAAPGGSSSAAGAGSSSTASPSATAPLMALNLIWPRSAIYGAGAYAWGGVIFVAALGLVGAAYYLWRQHGRHHEVAARAPRRAAGRRGGNGTRQRTRRPRLTGISSVTSALPSQARAVVIGGGVIGTSVAYHLAKLGWTDLVLLEQGQLSCGTTWHAAGLVGQLRANQGGTRLVQYSTELYSELERETGLATGFKRCGGVTVARTQARMTQLRRTAATAAAFGLECELLTPAQAADRYPVMRTDDLVGAIWLPGDGKANPVDLTASLARGARQRGARIFERTRVLGVTVAAGRVTGVRTDAGDIAAEVVVNCAGQWAKQVGALAGVNVPLHSAEHFYVVTDPIDGVHTDLPVLRDPDGYTYFKEEVGGLVVGGFEPEAKPWVAPDQIPYPFEFKLLDEDWEHFSVLMDSALLRIPALSETGIRKFYNGPESFTPDNQFILGEAPEVRNFFVAAGFNSVGIATAGGAGRALAEWIDGGSPSMDLTSVDIRRFAAFNGNNQWLHDRVAEVLGLHYEIPWPNREMRTARPFRRSPVYHLLRAANANFGSRMGWERANFFAPAGALRPRSSTPGAGRTGCPGPRRSSALPVRRWRYSTRPRSPSSC